MWPKTVSLSMARKQALPGRTHSVMLAHISSNSSQPGLCLPQFHTPGLDPQAHDDTAWELVLNQMQDAQQAAGGLSLEVRPEMAASERMSSYQQRKGSGQSFVNADLLLGTILGAL